MNNVVLVGRLVRDPELRYIPGSGTPVASFTLAIDRDYKDSKGNTPTDFIPVEVMGKAADFVANYLTKGRLVAVHGTLRVDTYMKDDKKRTFTKVAAKSVQALESVKKKDDSVKEFVSGAGLSPDGFQAIDDDEIPF